MKMRLSVYQQHPNKYVYKFTRMSIDSIYLALTIEG
jgi:hypothetical protein